MTRQEMDDYVYNYRQMLYARHARLRPLMLRWLGLTTICFIAAAWLPIAVVPAFFAVIRWSGLNAQRSRLETSEVFLAGWYGGINHMEPPGWPKDTPWDGKEWIHD